MLDELLAAGSISVDRASCPPSLRSGHGGCLAKWVPIARATSSGSGHSAARPPVDVDGEVDVGRGRKIPLNVTLDEIVHDSPYKV